MKYSYISKSTKLLNCGPRRSLSLIAVTIAIYFLATLQAGAQVRTQWQRIGPYATLRTVAIDPFDQNVIYAGGNGFYKIFSNGRWVRFYSLSHAADLAVDKQSPHVIYAASDGVYKSSDGGSSWTNLNSPPADQVQVSARDENVIVAADANMTIFATVNGGMSWVTRVVPSEFKYPHSIAIDPQDPNNIFVSYETDIYPQLYRSTSGGAGWNYFSYPSPGFTNATSVFSVHPLDSTLIYASVCTGPGCDFRLFKSTDGGASWSARGSILRAKTMAISPHDPGHIYFSTQAGEVFRSVDDGATFFPFSAGLPMVEINDLEFDGSGTILYAATEIGVFKAQVRYESLVRSARAGPLLLRREADAGHLGQ